MHGNGPIGNRLTDINLRTMKPTTLLILLATSLFSVMASAQWQWIDKDGRKVFSDRAPPTDVPAKSILKRPGQTGSSAPVIQDLSDNADPASAPKLPAISAAAPSALDKELAERKKKAEMAELAAKKAEADRVNKAKADACERAKLAQTGLNSGIRISRINKQGENEILDDAARAEEGKRLQSIAQANCK